MAVIDGQGTTFTFDDSGGSPVAVGQIRSFSGFDGSASEIDITNFASTAKEFRQGLQDYGNLTLEMQRDPGDAGQAEMLSAQALLATRECVLTLASGDVATFDAFVVSMSMESSVDEVVTGSATLRITGPVVWT